MRLIANAFGRVLCQALVKALYILYYLILIKLLRGKCCCYSCYYLVKKKNEAKQVRTVLLNSVGWQLVPGIDGL